MPTSYSWVLVTPTTTTPEPDPITLDPLSEDNESGYSIIRRHFNRFFSGKNWDAVMAALGEADDYIFELARNVIAQFTESTATGPGLDVLGNNQSVPRPWVTGTTDDQYRAVLVALNHQKVTYQSVLELLEALYGMDSLRAYVDSSSGPWALVDGQTITFNFGPQTYTFYIDAAQFQNLGAVTAIELGVALADWFSLQGLDVPIARNETQLRIYTPARGVQGRVTIGGTANLGFPTTLQTFQGSVRAVQPGDGTLTITVPAVALSGRTDGDPTLGGDTLDIVSLARMDGTIRVETAEAHGLTAGDFVEISGFTPALGRAWITPVSGGVLSASHTKTLIEWTTGGTLAESMLGVSLNPTQSMLIGGGNSHLFTVASTSLTTSPNHSDGASSHTISAAIASTTAAHADGAASALIGGLAGRVLLTGGDTGSKSCRVFNGSTWSSVADMVSGRSSHFQVTLNDGTVLVGSGDCERYNPVGNFWYSAATLNTPRLSGAALVLDTGDVLVAGGMDLGTAPLISCELYNPTTNVWTYTAPLSGQGGAGHLLAVPGGAVFVGYGFPIQVYSTATKLWRRVAVFDGQVDTAVVAGTTLIVFAFEGVSAFDVGTWRQYNLGGSLQRTGCVALGDLAIAAGEDTTTVTIVGGDNFQQYSRNVNTTHQVDSVTSSTTFTILTDDPTFTAMHSAVSASATRAGSTVTVTASIPDVDTVWVNSSDVNFSGGLKTVATRTSTTFTYTEAGVATSGTIAVGTLLSSPTVSKPATSSGMGFVVGRSAATASTAITREAYKLVSDILSPHVNLEWDVKTPGTAGLGHGDQNWE